MATRTIDDCLAQVRIILNDSTTPYRYSAQDLVDYFNSALYELKRLRPDVWLGSYGTNLTTYTTSTTTATLPFPEIFFQPVVYFVAGQAELRDDEYTHDGRTAMLLQSFSTQIGAPLTGTPR